MDKTAKMERVAEQVARLTLRHGMEDVTHAKLARAAAVSRPWLYKYVGRHRDELIGFMVEHFGLRLAELDKRPRCDTRALWVADSVDGLRIMVEHARAAPWLLPLYFRHVGRDDVIGQRIELIERRYLDMTSQELVTVGVASAPQARHVASLLLGTRLGLVQRVQRAAADGDVELALAATLFERWLQQL